MSTQGYGPGWVSTGVERHALGRALGRWVWLGLALLVSCGRENPGERSFTVRGVIRDFPSDGKSIVVRHEDIPGYMPKMTMDLTLADTNEARGLAVGDTIEFRLVAREEDHYIDRIRRLSGATTSGSAARVTPPSAGSVAGNETSTNRVSELKVGDLVPGMRLRTEEGKETSLADYQGRAVAMTFFFTRCPLPDFCPRMNRNFAEARERLRREAGAPKNWVFLSLSFDPEFDTPVVLKGYAKAYRGANPEGWTFAVMDAGALEVVKSGFDLKLTRDGGSFSHNLRTVVIDAGGRVSRLFDGNRWTAAELAEAMSAAARSGTGAGASAGGGGG